MSPDADTDADVADIVRRYIRLVYATVHRHGGRPGSAHYDDMISDGMYALWRAARDYDPTRGTLGAWLARHIRWAVADHWRARGRELPTIPWGDLDEQDRMTLAVAGPGDDQHPTTALADLLEVAGQVDQRLPVIVVGLGFGLTQDEAGSMVGLRQSRVGELVARLRQHLQKAPTG